MNNLKFDKSIVVFVIIMTALFFVFSVIGCKTKKVIEKTIIVHDSIHVENVKMHDSLINVIKRNDSASIRLNFKCDSLGQIYITKINQLAGEKQKIQFVFKDNMIYVKCQVDSLSIAIKWADKITKTSSTNSKVEIQTIVQEVNRLTQWQVLQMWGSRLFVLLIVLYILYRLIIKYTKFVK